MSRQKKNKNITSRENNDVRFGTPPVVASYRATRLCENADTIIEVGAGAGFQTAYFAKKAKKVIAVEIDAERFARFTDVPENVTKIEGDALSSEVFALVKKEVVGKAVVFLDPERPAQARERTLEEIRPDIPAFIALYNQITADIAIELPPFLQDIPFPCEKEFLSVEGQLNRLDIYLGDLMRCDTSVVALPSGKRIEHMGEPKPIRRSSVGAPSHILLPDRALAHANLVSDLLPVDFEVLPLGNQEGYLVRQSGTSPFFRRFRIVTSGGKKEIVRRLTNFGGVVLHGRLEQEEQNEILHELRPFCRRGTKKLGHIFLGKKWYLTTLERKD